LFRAAISRCVVWSCTQIRNARRFGCSVRPGCSRKAVVTCLFSPGLDNSHHTKLDIHRHRSHSPNNAQQGLSDCPSVCPIYRPLQQRAVGLLPWAPRAGDIDRLLHGASAAGAAAFRSVSMYSSMAAVSSRCEQCHVSSRRSRLNTQTCLHRRRCHNQLLGAL